MGIVVLGAVFVDIKGYPQDVYIPGGRNAGRIVSRNVVEDIANVELRPTFVSLVDDTGLGEDVVRQLRNHKVNTDYMLRTPDGMGTWLAVFNNDGDVCAAISKRPDLRPLIALLDEKGDEIFRDADSIALELDMDKEIVKRVFAYAQKYHKSVYAVVSNMTIAVERRDFLQQTDCFVCNRQEAGILFGPTKAANAGGVAVSALEMAQNSMRLFWTKEEVDAHLKRIMEDLYRRISAAAEEYSRKGDLVSGANIAGFKKVADAMLAQGVF